MNYPCRAGVGNVFRLAWFSTMELGSSVCLFREGNFHVEDDNPIPSFAAVSGASAK
ncbi:MAG: hypothetical protein IT427_14530 [Pirellulales bacterium]|nr:hypothetical protein [Pirellulales bacterium]